jgi:hypothetical protein
MSLRVAICASLCLVTALAVTAVADEGPPDPISLDRQSPSVIGGQIGLYMPGATPGNIYDMNRTGSMPPAPPTGYDAGGPGPIVHAREQAFSLIPMADNVDGLSNGEVSPPDYPSLSVYFSGDDASQGLPQTDYRHQANRRQAAGDRFMVNGVTALSPVAVMVGGGPSWINGPQYPGGLNNWPINLLSANQHRYNEIPSIGPAAMNTYMPPAGATQMDDMDALELTPLDLTGDRVHDIPIYFSLDATSPTLNMLGASPADILMSPPGPSAFWLWAPSWSMGLTPDDEVDALAVWNMSNGQTAWPGMDYALFSLAPGSPYLMMTGGSPADIYVTNFSGMNQLYLPFFMLGMGPEDNVDALDVEYVAPDGMIEMPLDQVVGPILPGDYNGNGIVDAADYTVWRDHLGSVGMPGIPGDGDDGSMTGNPDGIVDILDFLYWKFNYGTIGYGCGSGSVAAAVPEPASLALATLAMVLFAMTAAARRK